MKTRLTDSGRNKFADFLRDNLKDFPRREVAIIEGDFESDINFDEGFFELGKRWTLTGVPATITFSDDDMAE